MLIVADEPVSALDVSVQAQVLNLFADLRERLRADAPVHRHDLAVVRHLCDRVAVMRGGEIVEIADSDTLYDNPTHEYTRSLLRGRADPRTRDGNAPAGASGRGQRPRATGASPSPVPGPAASAHAAP